MSVFAWPMVRATPDRPAVSSAFDFGGGVKLGPFEAAVVWDTFHEKVPEGISSWITFQAGINIGL